MISDRNHFKYCNLNKAIPNHATKVYLNLNSVDKQFEVSLERGDQQQK